MSYWIIINNFLLSSLLIGLFKLNLMICLDMLINKTQTKIKKKTKK